MHISLRFTFKKMRHLLTPVNLDPLLGTGFSFCAFLHSHALEGEKMTLVFWGLFWTMKKIWLWCFQRCLRSCGHSYPSSLIWGKWFCNFCIYLLWIAKFLGNTLNSFSNSKDMSHQAECGVQPNLGGIIETRSPLAFLRQLPAGKQQRSSGSGQFPVDLSVCVGGGRWLCLKCHWKQNLTAVGTRWL